MLDGSAGFLSPRRLLLGPWQAFEREVARLMISCGFTDVRIVGGSGDRGADVLGVQGGQLWVFQCKHTTTSSPPAKAADEVVEAGRWYSANRLVVATSRQPAGGLIDARDSYAKSGLVVELAGPDTLMKLADSAPEYSPLKRDLRPYQIDATAKLESSLLRSGRGQLVLATGLGKTVVLAQTVANLLKDGRIAFGRVLVLAHTIDIVKQLHQAFWYQLSKTVPTHQMSQGEFPSYWDGVTFATVQSLSAHLSEVPQFGLVVIDEAHHSGMPTFLQVIEGLQPSMLCGATATPWRGDEMNIDTILGSPVMQLGIPEGLRQGFLAEVDYRLLADNLDWAFIQDRSRNRYSIAQLNRRLIIPTRDEVAASIVADFFRTTRRRRGLVFSPSIVHAESFSGLLRKLGFSAEAIFAGMLPRERDKVMSRFRGGN
jgi:superfamily II DNA or RNA helicase